MLPVVRTVIIIIIDDRHYPFILTGRRNLSSNRQGFLQLCLNGIFDR